MSRHHAVIALILSLLSCSVAFPDSPAVTPSSVHAEPWQQRPKALPDPAVESFVQTLLDAMTVEEKVGQMIQADIASIEPADLQRYKLGSILAGGNAAPHNDLRCSPQAWLDLTSDFYRASLRGATQHPPIPIIFGIDAVHGNAKLRGATIFPHNVALGAAHDAELLERIGAATAEEVAAIGVDWVFAPTVAVVRDVRWGRSYESYSEDPALVALYAPRMVRGLQGRFGSSEFMSAGHTLSSVKHFLGDGGTEAGRDQGNTVLSEADLAHWHSAAYPTAFDAGALIVMASYSSWNGTKLHASHHLLTDVLKEQMGFNGFVVGDWNAHEQIPGCTKYRCAAAILAGVDMLMAPDSWKLIYANTLLEVADGEIPAARIDDAVRRILRVKVLAGLFTHPPPAPSSGTADFAVIGSHGHREIAREAVRKSLVLLKNDSGILPLNPGAHILVAGELADDIGAQSGGWTIDWQGDHNRSSDFPGGTSIYAGIKHAVVQAGGSVTLNSKGHFTRKPDVAIVIFGERPYAEFEGDRENVGFSMGSDAGLSVLRRLRAAGVPTVSIFLSGRPLWVNPELNASTAFVAAWLPGSEGEGVADVLFAAAKAPSFDFTGKLSFSWPRTAMPVSFDRDGNVSGALFKRGFGLTYADKATLPRLDESPQVPDDSLSPAGSLFRAGHVTAPWSIFVADRSAEVHLTNSSQQSPLLGLVATQATDTRGITAVWKNGVSSMIKITGRAQDMRHAAQSGSTLEVHYRVDLPPDHAVRMGMLCLEPDCGTVGGALLDLTAPFKTAEVGAWNTLELPLSCLLKRSANLAEVTAPFALETSGSFALTIAEVRLTQDARGKAHDCGATR